MNLELTEIPRVFNVNGIDIKDYGKIELSNDEMISFKTKSSKEYDFTAKEWGFYASASMNGRLKNEGFKMALVVNEQNMVYVMAVEKNKIEIFKKYLKDNQDNRLVCWLDEFFTFEEEL